MNRTVDARGLACPQPVVLASKAIAAGDEVTVLVDDEVAVENITRLARAKGFSIEVARQTDGIHLALRRQGAAPGPAAAPPQGEGAAAATTVSGTVVFVPSDCLGRGPAELGERLLGAFFHTLLEVAPRPQKIIFMNTGVKLAVEGSRALDDLQALAALGVDILACGACLNYFELSGKLAVGRVSNMFEIATALLEADRLVEL